MYKHIVVPLDGSEFSRTAIPYALSLASPGSVVELVSSVEVVATLTGAGFTGDISAGIPGYGTGTQIPAAADLLESSRRNREEHLEATAESISTEATVRWTLLEGSPADAVAAHVEETGADLVVLSTHGRGGLERAWVGSVADRLVRALTVPMLLIRPTDESGADREPAIRRILVPLDGSSHAEAVLEPVRDAARALDAEIVLLRVVEPDLVLGSPYIPHAARELEEHHDAVSREAVEYLDGIATGLEAQGVRVAAREVRMGVPARAISGVTDAEADMVAMATHGRGGLRRWVLGSVSDKVLRRGTRPMLLVRPEEAGETE